MDKKKILEYLNKKQEILKREIKDNSNTVEQALISSKVTVIEEIVNDIESDKFKKHIWE